MTSAQPEFGIDVPAIPTHSTLVLLNRELNPKHHTELFSVFADDVWDLTPAIFEAHEPGLSVKFTDVPSRFKAVAKLLCWLQLNHTSQPTFRRMGGHRLSVRSVALDLARLKPFLNWLDTLGVISLSDVTVDDYSAYLAFVRDAPLQQKERRDRIVAVQRLWAYRDMISPTPCLPDFLPWDGLNLFQLSDSTPEAGENRTPRIAEATMSSLLQWAVRFVEDFGQDITDAFQSYHQLCNRNDAGRRAGRYSRTGRHLGDLRAELVELLDEFRTNDLPLPGTRNVAGELVVSQSHISRLLNCSVKNLHPYRTLIATAAIDLGIADGAPLEARIMGALDGNPWRDCPVTYHEAPPLARHLSTACFIVIAYLSGMRPGEALNLSRGCATHDDVTSLDFIHGKKWKGAIDEDGAKNVRGEERDIPWTVVPIVIRAVKLLEDLHDSELLFPTTLHINGRTSDANLGARGEKARTLQAIVKDIAGLMRWIEGFCRLRGRTDTVVADPLGRLINPSRFRRTLAWFIWHRPRGAVAAALQYGHVKTRITQGYAGTYASGFPDEYAFEDFLGRLEALQEDDRRLRAGEHVSGPGAAIYRDRVSAASARFSGRTFHTARRARIALSAPNLQVFQGRSMTCAFDPKKALCQVMDPDDDVRRTPDIDNCRPACRNIARTERDIDEIRSHHRALIAEVENPLAPEPRRHRARQQAELAQQQIDAHEATRNSQVIGREDERVDGRG